MLFWRDNSRGHRRRGHAIKDKKPKGIYIAKALRKDPPDVDKLVDALLELIKQLCEEDGLGENWKRKQRR